MSTSPNQRHKELVKSTFGENTANLVEVRVPDLPTWEEREGSGDCGIISIAVLANCSYQVARRRATAYGWKHGKGINPTMLTLALKDRFGDRAGRHTRQFIGTSPADYLNRRPYWKGVMVVGNGDDEFHAVPVVNGIAVNMETRHWDFQVYYTLAIK